MYQKLARRRKWNGWSAGVAYMLLMAEGCCLVGTALSARTAVPVRARAGVRMALWVPAYFYPEGRGLNDWNRLIAAASRAPVIAILNPDSGPGSRRDPNYTAIISRARRAGVVVVGYVSTRYSRKPLAQVEAEVDKFVRFYPGIQGIHFDEQASEASSAGYYTQLYHYAHRRMPGGRVLTNPGTDCASVYVTRPASDGVCLFESDHGFESFRPPGWTSRYSPFWFSIVAYHVGSAELMDRYVWEAAQKRIGYVYITDAGGANPYDRLPSYWDQEVGAVEWTNQH